MEIIKILIICLITGMLSLVLKQYRPDFAAAVSITGGITVLIMILLMIASPIELLKKEIESCGIDLSYFAVALKALGIGIITEFISSSCKENGQLSLASKAELAGKTAIFIITVPVLISVLRLALNLLK